jgi:hypothetical protein
MLANIDRLLEPQQIALEVAFGLTSRLEATQRLMLVAAADLTGGGDGLNEHLSHPHHTDVRE